VTALNDLTTQLKAVESGADDFLTKPIEEKLLLTKAAMLTELSHARVMIRELRSVIDAYAAGDIALAQERMSTIGPRS
jgi:DNA-binding response OmpR family regulator